MGAITSNSTVEPAFFSLNNAAIFAGISDDSIRKLIVAGRLTAHRPVPGRTLISRKQLEAVLDSSAGASGKSRRQAAKAS